MAHKLRVGKRRIVSSRQYQRALECPSLPLHISTNVSETARNTHWRTCTSKRFSLSTNLVWSSIFIMEGSIHLPHVLKFRGKRKFEVRASCELTPKPSKPFTLVYTAWKHAKLGEKRLARCSKIWNIARLQYPVSVLVVRHRYMFLANQIWTEVTYNPSRLGHNILYLSPTQVLSLPLAWRR